MRDSIFIASIRSLFVSLFAVVGIGIGLTVLVVIISMMSSTSDEELATVYSKEILPNADGIRKSLSKEAPVILQVNINGIIGVESLSTKSIRQQLIESREGTFANNQVKGILLHINSPGGTVDDSYGIYSLLKEYKEKYKVPIYAYVDGLCASGGMFIACAADKVYASEVSLIGSVGVILPSFLNINQMLEKIGVSSLTLIAGKGKDEMNPLRPWKPGEEASYQSIVDYYYQQFLDIVVLNRHRMSKTKLVEEYGAHVFPAAIAKQYGYIDESGNSLADAQKALLKELGIEGNYYQVIQLENKNWWTGLFSSASSLFKGKVTHVIQLSPDMPPELTNKFMYLYTPH